MNFCSTALRAWLLTTAAAPVFFPSPMRLALIEPDIPQNAGAMLRLAACFALPVDVIHPCGFLWDDKKLRRAGMDYAVAARPTFWRDWDAFAAAPRSGRLVLLTTRGAARLDQTHFQPDDVLMVGSESAGAPDAAHAAAAVRVRIPLVKGMRSLNVAQAAAIVAAEALRQTGAYPDDPE